MTTLQPPAPDYTDRDFASINKRLELLLMALFTQWTDFNRSNFGVILKEGMSWVGDVLSYYLDGQARESRWGSAQQRKSIISGAKLINYVLDGASAATAEETVTITRTVSPGGTVTIPQGTFFSTKEIVNPQRFQSLADLIWSSGVSGAKTVDVENSETQQDLATATGEENEEFILSQIPFLDDSQSLTIDGNPWSEVDHFLDSGPTDRHYKILVDENDRATIRLGDGNNGATASAGAAVQIDYKTGGGRDGIVEAGSISKFEPGSWTDSLGNPVKVEATNVLASDGGTNRETVAEARENAPRSLRVLNRCVTRTDFEDLAVQVQGVARALMVTKNEYSLVAEYNRGYLYIVPEAGGVPTTTLKNTVENYINTNFPIPLTFDWEARDPEYNTINVAAVVYLTANAEEDTVATLIREALSAYFAPLNDDGTQNTSIDFGFNWKDSVGDPDPKLPLSTIGDIIKDTAGIRRLGTPDDGEGLELNSAEDDVDLTVIEFPKAGTLTLVNGDTSSTFYSGSID